MERVAEEADFNAVAPMARETLLELFGTERPTHEMIDESDELFELMDERGQGVYVVVYEGEQPSEIFFAGYSFD
jgi:hypothetical protein